MKHKKINFIIFVYLSFYFLELMSSIAELIFMGLSVTDGRDYGTTHRLFLSRNYHGIEIYPGKKLIHVFRVRVHRYYMKYLDIFLY